MRTILKKEFRTFFGTAPMYVVTSAFAVISALFLWFFDNNYNVFNLGNASLGTFFFIAPWLFMFLIPALSMRLFAEEEQTGTLEWLFTQPLKLLNIVLGKFFALLQVLVFMLLSTLVFTYTLSHFSLDGGYDFGSVISGYIGLFLLGALFSAIGVFVSSLSKSQVLAYVATVFMGFILYYGFDGLASYNLLGKFDYYLQQMGAKFHYDGFVKGLIDTRDITYFICFSALGLILTHYVLLKKRNR